MKKIIAKTTEKKEYFFSTKNIFLCERNAEKIVETLNEQKYKLENEEKWHIYDYDEYIYMSYITKKIYMTNTGNIKSKSI